MDADEARRLATDPIVEWVEEDAVVRAIGTQPNPPSWGLDRIDQHNLPLDHSYSYGRTASSATVYVIDTGIRTSHTTFGGRARVGYDALGGNGQDCNGHGTHVAGTVGGQEYGVMKAVRLVAVRVLNCSGSGTWSQVVSGVDWVTRNHASRSVANMSLGGGGNDTVDAAVRNSIAGGTSYVVASGNSNTDACSFSPARVREAIMVNASDSTDARAGFSNWGNCTDIFAPGVSITSAWNTSDTARNTISGTSMAAPHAAGVAASWRAGRPDFGPKQVAYWMMVCATQDKVADAHGSPNRLLYSGCG